MSPDGRTLAVITGGYNSLSDFSTEDRVPFALFDRVLWEGTKRGVAYPSVMGATAVSDD